MQTKIKTAPTVEPVSIDEAKRHCVIDLDDTDHDDYINGLITMAREWVESYTWRKLITQTWYAYLDDWPSKDWIELPFGELQSVTSVKYYDTDNTEYTWSTTEYIVGTEYQHGRITLADGYTWPNENLYPSAPIVVEFVCGYGDTAASVPASIKHALKMMIAETFENREMSIAGVSYQTMDTVYNLLSDYRLNDL